MNGLRFDTETLAWFARRSDPSLALAGAWSSIDWQTGFGAIERLYDLKRSTHFLRHHRGLLPRLWERQITEALRAMLLEMPSMKELVISTQQVASQGISFLRGLSEAWREVYPTTMRRAS